MFYKRMKETTYKLTLVKTLSEINRLVNTYYTDCYIFKNMSIPEFFNYVSKQIKYDQDEQKIGDIIRRPGITIEQQKGDCDCKTVLCLSYFKMQGIKCGYSLVSERKNKTIHHIFPFYISGNKKIDYDATYNFCIFPDTKQKKYTYRKDVLI